MEADLVKRVGVPFEAISAAGVHGVGWRALPGNLQRLASGYFQSRQVLRRFRPDVQLFTGGYVAVPMALAGRNVPSLLFVPDIEPGLALKTLARFADRIAASVDETCAYFPRQQARRCLVSGYPTRPDLSSWQLEDARQALGLSAELPVLLVFGGSSGARSINQALLPILAQLLEEMQVVHISGQRDWQQVQSGRASLAEDLARRYRPFPYLHERMGAAFQAADLAVSRAGASSLGEFPAFGLPAILVPYPYAWRYQQVNAGYLSQKGAAVVIADSDLPERLLPLVLELMRDRPRREQMRQAMRALARPQAAETIAQLLVDLSRQRSQEGSKAW
jgi:UDP-N-acetylglucosamine:LPS N-acetylglucosamine transferase